MKKKLFLLFFSLVAVFAHTNAASDDEDSTDGNLQEESPLLLQENASPVSPPVVIPDTPTSPQAQAFSRLGDYEANNSSGILDIGIPLFEIDFYGYKIPFNLRYEAQPLNPGHSYDVYGRGWALSGNACVSRTIHDRADEDLNRSGKTFEIDQLYHENHTSIVFSSCASDLPIYNFQYDSFNITLPSGRNIPFYIKRASNNDLEYVLLPSDQEVSISFNGSLQSFTVIDEDGVTYKFYETEQGHASYLGAGNEGKNISWLLTEIIIPGKGTITYQYGETLTTGDHQVTELGLSITHLFALDMPGNQENAYTFNTSSQELCGTYTMKLLTKIIYGTSEVNFNYTSNKKIDSIVVKDHSSRKKKYLFNVVNSNLQKLAIYGTNDSDHLSYRFDYYGISHGNNVDYWGNYSSSSNPVIGNFNLYVDNLGVSSENMANYLYGYTNYLNLISSNTAFPRFHKLKLQRNGSGEDRYASSPESHGVLKKITYPNGGRTEFTFENHKFLTATASNGDLVFNRRQQRSIEGGGFRIKSVKNYTADGTLISQDEYRYGYTYQDIRTKGYPFPFSTSNNPYEHNGLGEAVVDPNLLTFLSFDYSTATVPTGFLKMLTGVHTDEPGSFENLTYHGMNDWWWQARFSALNFRKLLGGRRAVVYPQITVYHGDPESENGCIGKTVYDYDIYAYDLSPSRYYLGFANQTAAPDTAYFEPPYYLRESYPALSCSEKPSKRDQLVSKKEYGKGVPYYGLPVWKLNNEEYYTYREYSNSIDGFTYNSNLSRGQCGYHTMEMAAGRPDMEIYLHQFYSQTTQHIGSSKLASKMIRQKSASDTTSLTMRETYSYTFGGNLSSQTYWDEYSKTDNISYVGNSTGGNSTIESLRARHILSPIVFCTTNATVRNQSQPVSGYKVDYAFFGDNIFPSKLYERIGSNYEESVQIISYSPHGNPTESVDLKTGIHTAYVWGYDDRYMVIRAENATYSSVINALGNTVLDNTLTINSLNAVRNNESLQNALIQTWTHIPLIGIKEYTDQTKLTTKFDYDGLGRLTKDYFKSPNQEYLLHEYMYNFKNPE